MRSPEVGSTSGGDQIGPVREKHTDHEDSCPWVHGRARESSWRDAPERGDEGQERQREREEGDQRIHCQRGGKIEGGERNECARSAAGWAGPSGERMKGALEMSEGVERVHAASFE